MGEKKEKEVGREAVLFRWRLVFLDGDAITGAVNTAEAQLRGRFADLADDEVHDAFGVFGQDRLEHPGLLLPVVIFGVEIQADGPRSSFQAFHLRGQFHRGIDLVLEAFVFTQAGEGNFQALVHFWDIEQVGGVFIGILIKNVLRFICEGVAARKSVGIRHPGCRLVRKSAVKLGLDLRFGDSGCRLGRNLWRRGLNGFLLAAGRKDERNPQDAHKVRKTAPLAPR